MFSEKRALNRAGPDLNDTFLTWTVITTAKKGLLTSSVQVIYGAGQPLYSLLAASLYRISELFPSVVKRPFSKGYWED